MKFSTRIEFDELRRLGFGSIGAAYTSIGDALAYPARMIILQNFTDAMLVFSDDGVTDKLILGAYNPLVLDITTNGTDANGLYLGAGDRLYVKQEEIPLTGSVFLTVIYGSED